MNGLDSWWRGGEMRTLRVGATERKVFVRIAGSGTPLLLLHGFPASSYEWADVWPTLTRAHRVIAPDFLGFGASDKPPRHRYTLGEQADLVQALLAALEVANPSVLTYDYGAIITQLLLARGVVFDHVVLSNAGLFSELYRPRLVQKLATIPVLGPALGVLAANERTFARSWSAVFSAAHPLADTVAAEHWRAVREGNPGRTLQARLLSYIPQRAADSPRLESALMDNLDCISLLWGMQDPVSGPAIADELRRRRPNVDLVEYQDAGHCPHLEIPARVAEDVLARTAH